MTRSFAILAVVGFGVTGVATWWGASGRPVSPSLTPLVAAADSTPDQIVSEENVAEPASAEAAAPKIPPIDVKSLRKQFPFESLQARLAYEKRDRRNVATAPSLSETSRRALETFEQQSADKNVNVRAESLRLLHSDQVNQFARRSGFGMSRMIELKPSPDYLEYPEPEPIPLARAESQSAEQESEPSIVLQRSEIARGPGTSWTPSVEMLSQFHQNDSQQFAGLWSYGYVKGRDQVAGFRSHGLAGVSELRRPLQPEEGEKPPADHWKIARLELVSLLKFDQPGVYISENLPRMNELKKAGTRRLDSFEALGLEKLRAGEEIFTEAKLNEIRMLGAVRAAKQCMQCHDVSRGELLGAFSYRMKRDPAIPHGSRSEAPRT